MESEKLVKEIEKFMYKNNETFFSYAWREKVEEYLSSESRYVKLIEWIEIKIAESKSFINAFNPADKCEDYTVGYFKTYQENCTQLAMLINLKLILIDNRTTIKMRENIENTICKIYKINYSKSLNCYC